MYKAIIVAQLTYGLNTVQLTDAMLKRLDAFQMRGLRYIFNIEHAYVSHVDNDTVYEQANIALSSGQDLNISWEEFLGAAENCKITYVTKMSDYVMRQQNKCLGHVIRCEERDLMRYPTLGRDLSRNAQHYKGVGRPRQSWVDSNCAWAYRSIFNEEWNPNNPIHIQNLTNAALDRRF